MASYRKFVTSKVFFTVAAVAGVGSQLSADTLTWTGSASALWGTVGNWTSTGSHTTPSTGDSIVFPTGASNQANTNNLGGLGTLASLSITGGTYSLGAFAGTAFIVTSTTVTTGLNPTMNLLYTAPSAATNMAFDIQGSSGLTLSSTLAGSGLSITKNGTGFIIYGGTNTYGGGTTINAGTIQGQSPTWTGTVNLASTSANVNLDVGGGGTFTANYTGSGTVSIVGSGTAAISSTSNTYSGQTAISSGATWQAGAANAFSPNSSYNIGTGGTLDLNNFSQSIGSVTGTGSLLLSGSAAVDLTTGNDGKSTTFSGTVSGPGGFIQSGGTTTLSGTNSYAGGTSIVGGGTISTSADANLGNTSSPVAFNVGTLEITASYSSPSRPVILAGPGTFQVDGVSTTATYGGVFSGASGSLIKTGAGTLIITAANTYGGGTTVSAGVLQGTTTSLQGPITDNASLVFDQSTNGNYTNVISGTGSVTKQNTGIVSFSGANSYSGATSITNGTLRAVATNAFSPNSAYTVGASGTLDFNSNSNTLGSLAGSGPVTLGGAPGAMTTGNDNTSTTYSGIMSGTGGVPAGVTKIGTGTFTLSGANTYVGGTSINAGTISISADNNLGNPAAANLISFVSSGTLEITGGSFTSARNVTTNSGASGSISVDTLATTFTLSGPISGGGEISKFGPGVLALTNAGNSYGTGSGVGTAINAGTLQVSSDANLGLSTTSINFTGSGTLEMTTAFSTSRPIAINSSVVGSVSVDSGTGTLSGQITGSGALKSSGAGTLVLANATNSYSGGTQLSAGTLQITADGDLGAAAGGITFSGAATLDLQNSGTIANTRAVTLNAAGTFQTDSATVTLNGTISGSGSLTKSGVGTLVLGGSNGYSGGTNINLGNLSISADNNLGNASGGVTFNSTGILEITSTFSSARSITTSSGASGNLQPDSGVVTTLSGLVSGGGTISMIGQGILALTNTSNSYGTGSGVGTILNNGTLQLSSNLELGLSTTSIQFTGNSTLEMTTTFTIPRNIAINSGIGAQFFVDSAKIGTLSGTISSTGGLVVTGPGVLIVSGTNTYSGGTQINAGTLQITADANLGAPAGTISFTSPSILEFANVATISTTRAITLGSSGTFQVDTSTVNLNGAIGGSGNLTKTGAGILALGTSNTYSGDTVLNAGTVQISNDNNLGIGGNINFTGVSTFETTAAVTSSRTIALHAAGTIQVDTGTTSLSGVISNTSSLTKSGAGILALSGTNTYSGGTLINAGTLQVTTDANLGNAAGAITYTGASILEIAGTSTIFSSSRAVTLSANGTVQVDTGNTATLSGSIGSTGALIKTGTGLLTLSGANNYSGGTTVSAGTLAGDVSVNTTSIQGAITNNAIVDFTNSLTGTYAGNMSGSGQLQMTGAGVLILTGSNSYGGGTTVSSGTLRGDVSTNPNSIQGNVANSSIVNFTNTSSGTYAGILSGTGQLQMTGAGTLVLSGANTYSGATTAQGGGTISISSATALNNNLGNTSGLTLSTGTLQATATLTLLNSSSTAFPITISGGSALQATPGATTFTVNNAISGTGGLTSSGSGTLVLGGVNTGYTGGTTFTGGGTVQIGAANNLGTGTLTFNSGTLATTASFTLSQGAQLTGPGTIQTASSTNLTLSGNIAGTSTLTKTGTGTLTLAGNNNYSGGTTVSAGTLAGDLFAFPNSIQGNIANNSTVNFTNTGSGTYAGIMSGTGQLQMTGAGTLVLSGANSYSGATTAQGGGTISISSTTAINDNLGNTSGLTLSTGVLQATTTLTLLNSSSTAFPITLAGGGGTLQATPGTTTFTVNNAISGTGGLTSNGSGTLVLGGVNTGYSGGTTFTGGGIVQIGAANNLGSGTLTFNSGTLATTANFTLSQAGQLTGPGTIQTASSTNLTLSGNIAGTSTLTKTGAGTLTLSGSNNYSGGTTVSVGTLAGDTGANPGSIQGAITNNAIVNFTNTGATGVYAGNMSGSGQLQMTGTGTLTLSGSNSYSGGTTVSSGTLAGDTGANPGSIQGSILNNSIVDFTNTGPSGVYAGSMSGTGQLQMTGSGTLTLSGSNSYSGGTTVSSGILAGNTGTSPNSIQGAITNNAIVNFTNTGATGVYAGNMSGTGQLQMTGSGTLTLSGNNSYSGGTTVSSGILAGDTGAHVNSIQGAITNNAIVNFTNTGATGVYAGNMSGSGQLQMTGSGTLTLSGSNSYLGGTTVSSGILAGDTGAHVNSIQGAITNNAIVNFTNTGATGVYAGNMSGTGQLQMTGAGTLTLSGNNSYSGGTTVSSGTLAGDTGAHVNSIQGAITNNSIVNFTNTGVTGIYAGNMSGSGQLQMTGSGTLTLSGNNSYSGGTTVSSGILAGDVGASPGSIQGAITNNAIVDFTNTITGTYAGNMSGSGQLQMTGAGVLILTGSNSYGGGTTVSSGTLQGDVSANPNSIQGNVANSSIVNFTNTGSGTYAGILSGTGQLQMTGAGTLVLSGANTYSGATTAQGGGTISISSATAINNNLGNTSGLTLSTGTLQATASLTLLNSSSTAFPITLSGGGALQATPGATTFTVNNAISGTGGLTSSGSGTLVLGGVNTGYSGGTTFTGGGTVQIGAANNLGSGTLTFNSGTLATTASFTLSQGAQLTGPGTFQTAPATNLTLSGSIAGTSTLTKTGTGTLTLAENNTYSGGTTVSAGTLAGDVSVKPNSIHGIITNNSIVNFTNAGTGTYAGSMGGTGQLQMTGAGTLVLSGANSYSGATTAQGGGTISISSTTTINNNLGNTSGLTLSTGILQASATLTLLNSSSTAFPITLAGGGGTLQATPGTTTFTVNNAISGTGGLTSNGSGTLVLGGVNTGYSGGTTFTGGGTVQIGAANNLGSGTLTFNNGTLSSTASFTLSQAGQLTGPGTIQTAASTNLNLSGNIAGTSTLTKTGTGTLTLSGSNNYSGGTTVSVGTLAGDTGANPNSIQGAITNNSFVDFTNTGATGVYAGNMSGTGQLLMNGSGTLTLSGNNSYSGGTTVSSGILAGDTGANINSIQGAITNNAIVDFTNTGPSGVYAGSMSGSGQLQMTGSGTLTLSGSNSYSGGTTVSSGILAGNTGTNPNSIQGAITNNAIVNFTNTLATGVYAGNMSGTGQLQMTGSGTLTLSGNNSYSGGTTVSSGILAGNTGANPNSIQGAITNNAVVNFTNTGATGVYAGNMSGTGQLQMTGSGTLTLSGNNSYSGGTTVSSGTLQGDVSAHPTSIQGAITNNSLVNFTNIGAGTYAGSMGGTGQLQMNGAGTLVLSGVNNYSGGTFLNAGTVQISANNNLGSPSGPIFFTGPSTLETTATLSAVRNITLGAAGTFLVDTGTTASMLGPITGTGSLTKTGVGGTLILSGANNYSGGTTVSQGTLQGNTLSLQGNILDNASLVFDQTGPGTYSSVISGSGTMTKQNTGTLILTGANSYSGGTNVTGGTLQGDTTSLQGNISNSANLVFDQTFTGTYAGAISGTGTVVKQNTGTTVFSGANTYMGTTTISNGILSISTPANLSTGATTVSLSGGALESTATIVLANPIAVNSSGGTLLTGSAAVNFTLSSVIGGTGTLTYNGSGTFLPTNTNTYSGGSVFTGGGFVDISAAANLGSGGTLTFNNGGLHNSATLSLSQPVLLTGPAQIDTTALTTLTLSGNITGGSSLTKTSGGTLLLSGTNGYTGGTTVSAGTLQGDTNSLLGTINNNASVVFDQTFTGTFTGNINGTGSLTKQNTGTTVLSGTNSYSGGTTVNGGVLQGDTNSLQGAIAINATLSFSQSFSGVYSGVLNGVGSLLKQGSGLVNLTGTSTFNGTTTVQSGILAVNGVLPSAITVDAGATLQGTGTTGTVNVSGGVSPGNSIGTLNVNGNYTQQPGSDLDIEVDPLGNHDLLLVTGIIDILPGATLKVTPLPGVYPASISYTIAEAASVMGTFSNVVVTTPNFRGSVNVIYFPTEIVLGFGNAVVFPFSHYVNTGNAGRVAGCFDRRPVAPGTDLATVVVALDSLVFNNDIAGLTNAFDQMQPSLFQALSLAQENSGIAVRRTLTHRMQEIYSTECSQKWSKPGKTHIWVEGFGDFSSQSEMQTNHGYHTNEGGVVIGGDYHLITPLYLGAAIGYTHNDLDWNASVGDAEIESYYGALYGTVIWDNFYLDASVTGATNDYKESRRIKFSTIDRTARSSHDGLAFSGQIGTGYLYHHKWATLQPFARVDYAHVHEQGYSEDGAQSLDLKIHSKNSNMWRTEIGLDASRCFAFKSSKWIPAAYASWVYEDHNGNHLLARFKGFSCEFDVHGIKPHRNLFGTGASITGLFWKDRISAALIYDAVVASRYWEQQASLRISAGF